MLPFKDDEDFRQRRNVAAKYFCEPPKLAKGKQLVIRDVAGLMELSFALFAGWLFSGILNREKPLLRPCLLPLGEKGETSVLSLYDPGTHLAAPARRKLDLLDADYFTCPLDTATRPLTDTERHLCPVVNKLRYNLAHAKPEWNVTGLAEPSETKECCESKKNLLWRYLGRTLLADPDLYGSMVGGTAYPIQLPFSVLTEYLTGVSPGTKDLGKLLEETLLWFAMARSGVLMGAAHVIFTKPFECYEIDMLLYECAGKYRLQKDEPAGGWPAYVADQSICVMELTIGHQPSQTEDRPTTDKKKGQVEGNDAPKNKLVNYLALTSYGFRSVQANYVSFIRDKSMHQATQQALEKTGGFNYVLMPDRVGCDVEQTVLRHPDSRVPVRTVRDWHTTLVRAIEGIGESFAASLRR